MKGAAKPPPAAPAAPAAPLSPALPVAAVPPSPVMAARLAEDAAGGPWSADERERFAQALVRFGRDFAAVSQVVVSKSAAQCRAYFMLQRRPADGSGTPLTPTASPPMLALGLADAPPPPALRAPPAAAAAAGKDDAPKRRRGIAGWTMEERDTFLAAFKVSVPHSLSAVLCSSNGEAQERGRNWRQIQELLPRKSVAQIKHYYTLMRDSLGLDRLAPPGRRTRGPAPASSRPAASLSAIAAVALAVAQGEAPMLPGGAGSLAETVVRMQSAAASDSESISVTVTDSDSADETGTVASLASPAVAPRPAPMLDAADALAALARVAESMRPAAVPAPAPAAAGLAAAAPAAEAAPERDGAEMSPASGSDSAPSAMEVDTAAASVGTSASSSPAPAAAAAASPAAVEMAHAEVEHGHASPVAAAADAGGEMEVDPPAAARLSPAREEFIPVATLDSAPAEAAAQMEDLPRPALARPSPSPACSPTPHSQGEQVPQEDEARQPQPRHLSPAPVAAERAESGSASPPSGVDMSSGDAEMADGAEGATAMEHEPSA
jgi:hypothetical protein